MSASIRAERVPLANNTNTYTTAQKRCATDSIDLENTQIKKKARRGTHGPEEEVTLLGASSMDLDEGSPSENRSARNKSSYRLMGALASGRPGSSRMPAPFTTRPILQSFVSSNKTEHYAFHAVGNGGYVRPNGMSPACACSYSHAAKQGDKEILAIGTEEGYVHILNTSKRDAWDREPERFVLSAINDAIFDVQWRSDDLRLASSSGKEAVIHDVVTQQVIANLVGHTGSVKTVAWDLHNIDLLSSGGRDGSICLWDVRQPSSGPVLVMKPPSAGRGRKSLVPKATVTSLCYLPNSPNHIISAGSNDGILKKWDIRQNKKGKYIASTAELSLEDPTLLHSKRPRGIRSMALSGTTIYGLAADSSIHSYLADSLAPLAAVRPALSHERLVTNSFYYSIAVSTCGRWLASGGIQGRAFLFDITTRRDPVPGVEIVGHERDVSSLDWAANGTLITCSDDATARVWRPDFEVSAHCRRDEQAAKWDWAWASID